MKSIYHLFMLTKYSSWLRLLFLCISIGSITSCKDKQSSHAAEKQALPDTLNPYQTTINDTSSSINTEGMSAFMEEEQFWKIIESSKVESNDMYNLQVLIMTEKLRALPVEDIVKYENRFIAMMNKAYTWEMFAAARVIDPECTYHDFEYFRGWILSFGRKTFEESLNNPDILHQLTFDKKYVNDWEGFVSCAKNAFVEKTNLDYITSTVALKKDTTLIENIKKVQNLQNLYPKLWSKYRK
ncbi:MAG: DUF4240 domain-containing protein [Bacteroidia bacterium]